MININSRAEKVKHKIEKGNERYSKTSNSFDTGFFFFWTENRSKTKRESCCCRVLQLMEKQKKSCALMTEHFQKSVLFTAGQAQFSTTNKRLKSLLPRSTCCKLAASTGVDINRKYEQIINTVITRTIGQNDFIFTTGQASIEWHKRLHLRVAVWKSLQCYLSKASAKLIHWLCFKS